MAVSRILIKNDESNCKVQLDTMPTLGSNRIKRRLVELPAPELECPLGAKDLQ